MQDDANVPMETPLDIMCLPNGIVIWSSDGQYQREMAVHDFLEDSISSGLAIFILASYNRRSGESSITSLKQAVKCLVQPFSHSKDLECRIRKSDSQMEELGRRMPFGQQF
jgi:hypothetical protein